MRQKPKADRRCSYVVSIEKHAAEPDDLRSLADYLSILDINGCDVIVLDSSPRDVFEENRRVLRWVARHVGARAPIDVVRTAAELARTEKIIIARDDVRYDVTDLHDLCALLDLHEVVEPQDYLDPLPWWGGIEAGRMLVHRGVEPMPDRGATFGFRRGALRGLRGFDAAGARDPVRRLAAFGAEVFSAFELFVKRCPPALSEWWSDRPRAADDDFSMPVKTAFFFALIPMTMLLLVFGGTRMALTVSGAVAFASIALALRGRSGASAFFPLRACLYAPLWVLERSVSVYWALLRKVRFGAGEPARVADAEGVPGALRRSG